MSSNPAHGKVYSIQHYVIKFVSEMRQVSGFLCILWFPPPLKPYYPHPNALDNIKSYTNKGNSNMTLQTMQDNQPSSPNIFINVSNINTI